nr:MAG: hypothetical protein [Bacteriophage sp.]
MPRIKRLIQWVGDPNLLPNREKKTNIVYKDKSASYSSLIEVCENADNPSLPYVFTLGPAESYRVICVNKLSYIDTTNVKDKTKIFIANMIHSRYDSNESVIPNLGIWGMYGSSIVMPGMYLIYSIGNNVSVTVTPITDSNDIKKLSQGSLDEPPSEIMTPGFKLQKFTPIMLFSEFTNSRILWNADNTKAFISCGGGCFIPALLFRNGKNLKSERFNPESIRKALTSKDEVLLLFASLSYHDKELIKLKDGTTYKLNKTWEDLGLQDLYEEYLKSK